MSLPFDDADTLVKSLEPVAAGINKDALKFGRNRFEAEAYDRFIPALALHAVLFGTIFIVEFEGNEAFGLVLWVAGVALVAAHVFLRFQRKKIPPNLLGASAAFFVGTTAAYRLEGLAAIFSIFLPYALISICIAIKKVDPRELRATPVYPALMLLIADDRNLAGFSGYLLAAVVSASVLFRVGRSELAAGFLVGLGFISLHINAPIFRVVWDIVVVLGMLAYAIRFVLPDYSDLRNCITLAFAYAAGIVLVDLTEPLLSPEHQWSYWLTLVLFAAFSVAVWHYYKSCIFPTAGVWLLVTFLNAASFGVLGLFILLAKPEVLALRVDEGKSVLILLFGATGLYLIGRAFQSQFVCNLARLFVLGGSVASMRLAQAVHGGLVEFIFDQKQPASGTFAGFQAWNSYEVTWALVAILLTVVCTIASYKRVPFVSKVAWWRGLVSVRRAALLRAEYRGVNKTLEKTPVVKEVWKALRAAKEVGQFVKTGAPQLLLADIVAVIAFVYIVFTLEYLIDSYLIWDQAARLVGHIPDWWPKPKEFQWWTPIMGWSAGAILLYVVGLYCDQSLFFLIGAGFAFVPLVKYFSLDLHPLSGARIFVAAGLTLASCSILRWLFLRREEN